METITLSTVDKYTWNKPEKVTDTHNENFETLEK